MNYRAQDFDHDTLQNLINKEQASKPYMTSQTYNTWLGLGINVSDQTIRNLRNGTTNPSVEIATALANHFGVPLHSLYRNGAKTTKVTKITSKVTTSLSEERLRRFTLLKQFTTRNSTTPKQTAKNLKERRLAQFLNQALHGRCPSKEVRDWYEALPTTMKRKRGRPYKEEIK